MKLINKQMGIFKKLLISLLIVSLFVSFFHLPALVVAATSPWTQTDWSGGSGQTSWSDTTKFDASSGVTTSTSGRVTLSQTANWYDSSWKYRRKITFNNADQVENLTDFPVLVKINSSRINYSQTQAAGQDIRFTDSNGTTLLSYEIESWNESGDSYAWVKVPQIDASSTTDYIYIYYGNASASDAQSATSVWDSNYQVVYHLKEDPSGIAPQMQDSTSNNRDGTTAGAMTAGQQVTGKVNGSLDFDAANDYVNTNFNNHYSTYTFEGWVKLDSFGEGLNGRFVDKRQAGTELFNIFFNTGGGNKLQFARGFSTARGVWSTPLGSIATDTWYYLTVAYDDNPANDPVMYLNGIQQVLIENEAPSGTATTNTDNYIVGNRGAADRTFDGIIDEFRISNTVRSVAWVAASYKTQEDTFNTYAPEEGLYNTGSGTLTSSIFDTEGDADWGTATWNATTPSNTAVTVKVRTSDSSTMAGATDFSTCDTITSGADISSNNCVTDGQRYVQYQVAPSNSDSISTPAFEDFSLAFTITVPTPTPTPSGNLTNPSLEDPSDNSYTNSDRPQFKWKTINESGLSDYSVEVDNGDSEDFTISNIPNNRTSDYDTSKFAARYENFSDSDNSNNFISVHTKSSSDWGTDKFDGRLKEGKITWKVKTTDSNSQERSSSRTLFVDRTAPTISITQLNDHTLNQLSIGTTDRSPTFFGTVTDNLAGDSEKNRVASGPQKINITIEKLNSGSYTLFSSGTVNLHESYFSSDGIKIEDNAKNTSNKYSPFSFTSSVDLTTGTYRTTFASEDKAGNKGSEVVLALTVGQLGEIASPEEEEIIEEEIEKELPGLNETEKEEIKENLDFVSPTKKPVQEDSQNAQKIIKAVNSLFAGFIKGTMNYVDGRVNLTTNQISTTLTLLGRIVESLPEGVSNATNNANHRFAELMIAANQGTEHVSEVLGYAIVEVGYLFIQEPTRIYDVNVAVISPTQAKISWRTNTPANSKVNYGLDETYGFDKQSDARVKYHEFILTKLEPDTEYYFEVMSQNKNYVYDANRKFRTPKE